MRLDLALVERGLVESRSKAQALIMAGKVYSDTTPMTKAGQEVSEGTPLRVKERDHPWVSRGGIKLAHAIEQFDLKAMGCVAMDVGASTGGFTDVLLHHGAAKVYAVDVGHGQLDWKLRQHPNVVVLEKTNARHLTSEHIPEPIQVIVCDASFISLTKVLPAPLALAAPKAWLAALIKPQFEVGKGQVGKGGVVRDPALHQKVCDETSEWFVAHYPDWQLLGIRESPITGPEGNKEFLMVAVRGGL
jgi:23S rRNA (cytidine1920-2'-O)/16S rRNA (cytidine1409-2'-O)-methyltransferase